MRVYDLAREDHLHRFSFTNQTRQSLRPAATRNNAEINFRLTKRRRLTRDANVARERQLTTATETIPIDHCNHRLRKIVDRGEQRSSHHHVTLRDRRASGKLSDVCTCDKGFVAGASENDHANRTIVAKLFE